MKALLSNKSFLVLAMVVGGATGSLIGFALKLEEILNLSQGPWGTHGGLLGGLLLLGGVLGGVTAPWVVVLLEVGLENTTKILFGVGVILYGVLALLIQFNGPWVLVLVALFL